VRYAAYQAEVADGLVSRKRCALSNRKLAPELRELAVKLVRGQYADFAPPLADEKLTEVRSIPVSLTTVRKWMVADGEPQWPTSSSRKPSRDCPRHTPAQGRLSRSIELSGADRGMHLPPGRG